MPLIYRDAGPWGAGKGSNLVPQEVDGNFYELMSRVLGLEALPIGVSIDYFEIIGSSLYVHMTDHSLLGPYPLPVAQWRYMGEWQPDVQYMENDVITAGGKTYLVLFAHISVAPFDAGASDGGGHNYYGLLLENPDPIVDLALHYAGRVHATGAVIFQHIVVRAMKMPAGLVESQAYLRIAPSTVDVSFRLYRNGVQIGAVNFANAVAPDMDGGQPGVFTFAAEVPFVAGDRFSIAEIVGTEDAIAEGLSITIKAVAG